MKKQILIMTLGIILLISLSFISSEEIKNYQDLHDITKGVGGLGDVHIYIEGMDYDFYDEGIFLEFVEENARLYLEDSSFDEPRVFTNIVSNKEEMAAILIDLNEDLTKIEVLSAEFKVNENGGNYIFETEPLEIPPNIVVVYHKEKGVEFRVPDDFNFSTFQNLLDYIEKGYVKTIRGTDMPIFKDLIFKGHGEVEITEKGYSIVEGTVKYKDNFLIIKKGVGGGSVVIADENADMSDYEGNWIRQTEKELDLHSKDDGFVTLRVLENNKILNNGDVDNLLIQTGGGDGIKFVNRNEAGLIPLAFHYQNEEETKNILTSTKIANGGVEHEFEDGKIYRKRLAEDIAFFGAKESVPMQIESTSGNLFRINAYNQYTVSSKGEGKESLFFNRFGYPISEKIEHNTLKTIEQLKEKYPNLEFESGEDLPPFLVYFADSFIKLNPTALEKVDKIVFDDASTMSGFTSTYKSVTGVTGAFFPEEENPTILTLGKRLEPTLEDLDISDGSNMAYPLFDLTDSYRANIIPRSVINKEKRVESNQLLEGLLTGGSLVTEMTLEKKQSELVNNIGNNMFRNRKTVRAIKKVLKQAQEHADWSYSNEEMEADIASFSKNVRSKDYSGALSNLNEFYAKAGDSKSLKPTRDKINKVIKETTGAPNLLSLRLFALKPNIRGSWSSNDFIRYYMIQGEEERRNLGNSKNKLTSETSITITQIAFDSGMIDVKEYKSIVGEDYCRENDCSDKLCIEYKLVCCDEHPESPNCS